MFSLIMLSCVVIFCMLIANHNKIKPHKTYMTVAQISNLDSDLQFIYKIIKIMQVQTIRLASYIGIIHK